MYRLMLYYLAVLFFVSLVLSLFRLLPYSPFDFLFPGGYLLLICWASNQLFGKLFKVQPNFESQFITALILILIIGPLPLIPNLLFYSLAGIFAMGSKYIFAINKQHIFNPAAFGVVGTGIVLNQGASWWAGSMYLLPFILIGGLVMTRKINRFNLVFSFLLSSSLFLVLFNKVTIQGLPAYIINPGTLFFAFVMLTEPITSPADKKLRTFYGVLVGVLMVIFQSVLTVFYTMELALLAANGIGRVIRFSKKYHLVLKEKKEIGAGIWQFLFESVQPLIFIPGQYLEWSLMHPHPDDRGTRRYFTIASSPTEKEVMLTVKIPEKSSTYKQALKNLRSGDSLYATNLEGDFVLDKRKDVSYVFIAGGIGITPFRSILKYMLDNNISAPITLFYVAHSADEFVFDEVFEEAKKRFWFKIVYVVSENPSQNWEGEVGRLTEDMIKKHVEDYPSRLFYLSGPQPMTGAYKKMLKQMKIKHIRTDYFPGYNN